jgi:hypothetical protein
MMENPIKVDDLGVPQGDIMGYLWKNPEMKCIIPPVLIHVLFGFSTKYTIQASYWGYPP